MRDAALMIFDWILIPCWVVLRQRQLKVKVKVMFRWGKVKSAESQENPLEVLPSFAVFNKNGVKFSLETKK